MNKIDEIIDLIENHWTKGELARDSKKNRVPPMSDKACYFCSLGAIAKVQQICGGLDTTYKLLKTDPLVIKLADKLRQNARVIEKTTKLRLRTDALGLIYTANDLVDKQIVIDALKEIRDEQN